MKAWAKDVFRELKEFYIALDPEEREFLKEMHKKKYGYGAVNDEQWKKMLELDAKYRKVDWNKEQRRLRRIENRVARVLAILNDWDCDYGEKYEKLLRDLRYLKRRMVKEDFYELLRKVAETDLNLFDILMGELYLNEDARETVRLLIRNQVLVEMYGSGYDSDYFRSLEREIEWEEYVYGRKVVEKKSLYEIMMNMYSVYED